MDLNNPFSQSIISDAWQRTDGDVPEIHEDVFSLCRAALDYIQETGNSRSILLHGLPGSGKTHLLARFRSLLTGEPTAESAKRLATVDNSRVVFTAVRLRAGPRMICRHLRRTLASDLFRATGNGMLQIERVLLHRFRHYFKTPEKAQRWWLQVRQPDRGRSKWWPTLGRSTVKAAEQLDEFIDRLDEEAALGRNLCAVIRHVSLGHHRRDARDWLREGVLPDALQSELGFVPETEDEDPELQALEVVCALSRMADRSFPLVLCFDQVEALQTHPEDMDGLFAFGQMISSLRDKTRHTLFISCVQTAFLDVLNRVIRGADMDRLAEKEGLLKPLSEVEAEHLVRARLDSCPGLMEERKKQVYARLWPLRSDRLHDFVAASAACTPRQLISFCDDEFESWRQGKADPVLPLDDFLETQFRTERERALAITDRLPSDEVLGHGLSLAIEVFKQGQCAGAGEFTAADLMFEIEGRLRYVSFCNQSGGPLTRHLKRLDEQFGSLGLNQLVILRDSRLPISKYAKKAREYFQAFEEAGAHIVRPTPEAIAELDALRSLLSDARSGDLANHGDAIAAESVIVWLKAHCPEGLHNFLLSVIGEHTEAARDGLYDELLELLQQRRVLPISQAAETLQHDAAAIERCVRRHLDQFGLLAGPPAVVFELVPDALGEGMGA